MNDALVSLLHSPRGETETRRLVWPDQSERQLVLFLLFHAKVRARADSSARETCIEKVQEVWTKRCKTGPAEAITHFYRIREEGGSGCPPPTVHLKTNDVTQTY